MTDLAALESRIQRLEDLEEIKLLRATLARGADDDHNLETIMPLFHEGASITYRHPTMAERFGRHEGKDAIRAYLSTVPDNIMTWSVHYWVSPIIKIAEDGKTATGQWYYWGIYNMRNPETDVVEGQNAAAVFHDDYIKVDGKWLFAKFEVQLETFANISEDGGEYPMIQRQSE